MVAWFVTMCILPDKTAGIAVNLTTGSSQAEVFVKFLQKLFLTAEKVDKTLSRPKKALQ